MSKRLFHYTVRKRLDQILADEQIKPAVAGVPDGVKPVVWCSFHPDWEQTANKMTRDRAGKLVPLNKLETHQIGGGLARIEVEPNSVPFDFADYADKSWESNQMVWALHSSADDVGSNPADWRCSFEPIVKADWVSVEVWNGIEWESYVDFKG